MCKGRQDHDGKDASVLILVSVLGLDSGLKKSLFLSSHEGIDLVLR